MTASSFIASVYVLDEMSRQWIDQGTYGTLSMSPDKNASCVLLEWTNGDGTFYWEITNPSIRPKTERAFVIKAIRSLATTQLMETLAIRFRNQQIANQFATKFRQLLIFSIKIEYSFISCDDTSIPPLLCELEMDNDARIKTFKNRLASKHKVDSNDLFVYNLHDWGDMSKQFQNNDFIKDLAHGNTLVYHAKRPSNDNFTTFVVYSEDKSRSWIRNCIGYPLLLILPTHVNLHRDEIYDKLWSMAQGLMKNFSNGTSDNLQVSFRIVNGTGNDDENEIFDLATDKLKFTMQWQSINGATSMKQYNVAQSREVLKFAKGLNMNWHKELLVFGYIREWNAQIQQRNMMVPEPLIFLCNAYCPMVGGEIYLKADSHQSLELAKESECAFAIDDLGYFTVRADHIVYDKHIRLQFEFHMIDSNL